MDIKEFNNFGFYSGVKAKVKRKDNLNESEIILIGQVDFELSTIYDEHGIEYELDEIIEFVAPFCDCCGCYHHPGENTLCNKKYINK